MGSLDDGMRVTRPFISTFHGLAPPTREATWREQARRPGSFDVPPPPPGFQDSSKLKTAFGLRSQIKFKEVRFE